MNATWYLRHFLGETNVSTAPGSGVFYFIFYIKHAERPKSDECSYGMLQLYVCKVNCIHIRPIPIVCNIYL